MSESIQVAVMWEHVGDANYERAAVHALRAADLSGARAGAEAAGFYLGIAQTLATLALAQAQGAEGRES